MLGVRSEEEPTSSDEDWEESSDRPSDNFPHEGNTEGTTPDGGEEEDSETAEEPSDESERQTSKKTERILFRE